MWQNEQERQFVLHGAGNGKGWESHCVSGWLRLSCATATGLKRQQRMEEEEEEAVTGTVLFTE